MPSCLRCQSPLEHVERAEAVQFWRCGPCQRDYAETNGQLTDRWLSPISIVLYGIIFSPRPQDEAARIAEHLLHARAGTPQDLALIVREIRDELARPKQRVRDILPLAHAEVTEQQVRALLGEVADRLEAARHA